MAGQGEGQGGNHQAGGAARHKLGKVVLLVKGQGSQWASPKLSAEASLMGHATSKSY
jgi:hypothetical protein